MPSEQNRLSRKSIVLGGVMWTAVGVALIGMWLGPDRQQQAEAIDEPSSQAQPGDGTSPDTAIRPGEDQSSVRMNLPERPLPDFEFEKVTGGTLSLADLKGKRWVASFVFSRCTTSCPMISRAVMKVHDRTKKSAPDAHFVSITVDPKYDTVEVFGKYAEIFTQGDSSRWSFLTGSQQEIYELVVKGFGQFVKENLGKSRMPGFEVAHTNRVVLVNEDGIPVATFLGTQEGDMVKLGRILAGREEFPEPGPPPTGLGLSFSRSDGTPLDVQFKVKPVDDEESTTEERSDAVESSDDDSTIPQTDDSVDSNDSPNAAGTLSDADLSVEEHNATIDEKLPAWARKLPTVNAMLNTIAGILLLSGLAAIKSDNRDRHRNLMLSAFATSAVFLGCYLTYHWALGEYTGEHGRRFSGTGISAVIYQLILWPHIILAVFVPILAIRVFMHAFAERWDAHRKLAKITFPIWMFVSVTGVVIYGMLYHWPVA